MADPAGPRHRKDPSRHVWLQINGNNLKQTVV